MELDCARGGRDEREYPMDGDHGDHAPAEDVAEIYLAHEQLEGAQGEAEDQRASEVAIIHEPRLDSEGVEDAAGLAEDVGDVYAELWGQGIARGSVVRVRRRNESANLL